MLEVFVSNIELLGPHLGEYIGALPEEERHW